MADRTDLRSTHVRRRAPYFRRRCTNQNAAPINTTTAMIFTKKKMMPTMLLRTQKATMAPTTATAAMNT
jgi:hypothetical protein